MAKKKALPKTIIIHFQDQGQDFTSWTVDTTKAGQITESKPFQGFIWTKYTVINFQELKKGGYAVIGNTTTQPVQIKYPIEKIERK